MSKGTFFAGYITLKEYRIPKSSEIFKENNERQ